MATPREIISSYADWKLSTVTLLERVDAIRASMFGAKLGHLEVHRIHPPIPAQVVLGTDHEDRTNPAPALRTAEGNINECHAIGIDFVFVPPSAG